ncbi:coenzyme F420-0:L-glutamate ligase/coenzyme F420-1:gamma-L-glutamate ligase [Propionibacteriaceae bacterium ES.041]|uniref:coenzyme F420-0:L-glutamate ligase n=1 Tax=Enemella evansiae TaxID=2016499 RepID=UPI000B95E863|nr:coenzyme F420-0:L-glutamate ligase [Enemella evansiae]OYN95099.1 coenzyme F420-0:L-glutamate ligase [Enemella evansiae]PFG66312.1 coenzyme F420-0:L-glutamate ligase/coenzyme F420-1:gamma-L-glutamate ligase [Propionibacteriaceae bacterium ES.041]
MITIDAPTGIGEITPGCDLTGELLRVLVPHDGDIWVVTSKVVSKAEGRFIDETDKDRARRIESRRVVARRGGTTIVEHRLGLVHAAAGIDSSNVEPGRLLLLPLDPDASARRIRAEVAERTGARIGVLISDTSGRAWRTGQTDLAIGVAGVLPIDSHIGRTDPHGNDLRVTEIAVADELCGAADLAKTKLGGRPVAVIRGLAKLVTVDDGSSADLLRPAAQDFFRLGRREAVLDAVLRATGQTDRYDELVELDGDELVAAVTAGAPDDADWITRLLGHAPVG